MIKSLLAIGIPLLLAGMTIAANAAPADDNLIFHFDFKDAQGKKEITDKTGNHTCVSKTCDFVIQDNALRIDDGADLYIPADKLPALEKELTVSLWVVKGHFGGAAPLLFKGIHPAPIQFLIAIAGDLPEFCYKNIPDQKHWKGIAYSGASYGSGLIYPSANVVAGAKYNIRSGYWTHITYVFKNGNIKGYNNGKLVLEHTTPAPELLKNNNVPICLGAEKVPEETLNYRTANVLLNDLRLYGNALGDQEVNSIYETEKAKYSQNSSLAKDAFLIAPNLYSLPPCNTYLSAMFKDYDPDFKNTLPITREYEKNLPKDPYVGKKTTSHVAEINGQMGLFVDGTQEYPIQAIPLLGEDNKFNLNASFTGFIRDFAAAGVDKVATGGLGPIPEFWLDEGKYNWAVFDAVFETMIKANPKAQIMPYLYLRPPTWFIQRFPEEIEKYYASETELKPYYTAAPLASAKWQEVSKRNVRDMVRHIEESSYAGHVDGYVIACGDAGEWYWPGTFSGQGMPGYSNATKERFRKWLKVKYENDDKLLQRAWDNAAVTLATAEVPAPQLRGATEHFVFRDKQKACQVFDYREFMNTITLENITETCKTVKESSDFKKAVFIYYGYSMLHLGKGATLHKGGLHDLSAVMKSPYVDVIITPLDYTKRRGGEPGLNINGFYASAKLHNKLIWQENDLRSHFHTKPEFGRTANLQETITVFQRGFGMSLTNGAGFWWMPFANSWYHQEETMRAVANIKRAADASLKVKAKESVSQVAIIFDEKSCDYTAVSEAKKLVDSLYWETYAEASRMGTPFDLYLLPDLKNPKMPDYKLLDFCISFSF